MLLLLLLLARTNFSPRPRSVIEICFRLPTGRRSKEFSAFVGCKVVSPYCRPPAETAKGQDWTITGLGMAPLHTMVLFSPPSKRDTKSAQEY